MLKYLSLLSKPSKRSIWLMALFPALIAGLTFITPGKASAAYKGDELISNSYFLNSKAMNAGQVQSFLESKHSGLSSRSFVLNCYANNSKERQYYNAAGAPCDQTIPASQIIYYASQVYGINPQVVLSTIQKEQSLVTTQNPTDWQINQAMGYNCPTTGNCAGNSTFSYQIDSGVWALRYHYERANGNMTWWSTSTSWTCGSAKSLYKPNLYPGSNVDFYDEDGVLYRTYRIVNAASSSLYCYTPHAYNNPQGLYGRPPFGTVGRYYSGSYNFVYYYELWFGSATKPAIPDCPTGSVNCVWGFIDEDTGESFYTTNISERNAIYIQNFTYTGVAFYSRFGADANSVPVYRLYNTSSGKHLWSSNPDEKQSLLASGSWTDEGIGMYADPTYSNSGYAVYRLYTKNDGGRHVLTDNKNTADNLLASGYVNEGTSYNSPTPAATPSIASPGKAHVYRFNLHSEHFYTTNLGERDALLAQGSQYEGVAWDSLNSSSGTIPTYRLYSLRTGMHIFTTNPQERSTILSWGDWRDEGISMYADINGVTNVYRFYSTKTGEHLFTTNEQERAVVSGYKDWTYEGVAWKI